MRMAGRYVRQTCLGPVESRWVGGNSQRALLAGQMELVSTRPVSMKTQRSLYMRKPDNRGCSLNWGKVAETNIHGHPGEPHPNLWSVGLNGQNLTSCLSPLLILNCPENKNKSSLFLGDHQGALLLVSRCSYPDALSVARETVANPLLHPALHIPLQLRLGSLFLSLHFLLAWTQPLSRQSTQRPLCLQFSSASRTTLLALSSSVCLQPGDCFCLLFYGDLGA